MDVALERLGKTGLQALVGEGKKVARRLTTVPELAPPSHLGVHDHLTLGKSFSRGKQVAPYRQPTPVPEPQQPRPQARPANDEGLVFIVSGVLIGGLSLGEALVRVRDRFWGKPKP